MTIRINGREEQIEKAVNIAELIAHKNLFPERVVVEHNLKILLREEWADAVLSENDRVEIVSFVQGG
jgi:sulfur carrier protein